MPTPVSNSALDPHPIRVLDVGCSAGDSLHEELQLRGNPPETHVQMVGVDIDEEALARGKALYPNFLFVHAQGEQLPFFDQSFDTVISRVALPYMDIPLALREMRRVLKVGGELRIKFHPFSYTLAELKAGLQTGSLRARTQDLVFHLYVIANGLALHLAGFNFHFPLARRHCESFQTEKGIRRTLLAAGFQQIDTSCWNPKSIWPHAGNCRASARRTS